MGQEDRVGNITVAKTNYDEVFGKGKIIAYNSQPTFTIERKDGSRFSWSCSLCKDTKEEVTMPTKIILYEDGPIEISNEKSMVTLCRCGQSANKPLCDGAHLGCDFETVGAEIKLDEHISIEITGT